LQDLAFTAGSSMAADSRKCSSKKSFEALVAFIIVNPKNVIDDVKIAYIVGVSTKKHYI
jgi:hypothetical protein